MYSPHAIGIGIGRRTYNDEQKRIMEDYFSGVSKYLSSDHLNVLKEKTLLNEKQIKIWFQNRRMKEKKIPQGTPISDQKLAFPPLFSPSNEHQQQSQGIAETGEEAVELALANLNIETENNDGIEDVHLQQHQQQMNSEHNNQYQQQWNTHSAINFLVLKFDENLYLELKLRKKTD